MKKVACNETEVFITKVSEHGNKCGVTLIVKVGKKYYLPIKIGKSNLATDEEIISKAMSNLEVDFTTEELKKIRTNCLEVMKEKSQEISEQLDFCEVVNNFYHLAERGSFDTAFIEGGYLNIKAQRAKLIELLDNMEAGWNQLEFKKMLKGLDMLVIGEGRPFDYKLYNPQVEGDKRGEWFLHIPLDKIKHMVKESCDFAFPSVEEIFEEGDVA